jgi:hypothetical protein
VKVNDATRSPVDVTTTPSQLADGQVVGPPIRIPFIMLCHQGERWCGWVKVANTRRQLPELMAERRRHHEGCLGGLILAG